MALLLLLLLLLLDGLQDQNCVYATLLLLTARGSPAFTDRLAWPLLLYQGKADCSEYTSHCC